MSNINESRRRLLKQGGALSAAGTFGSSLMFNLAAAADAAAANAAGYKAIVCIYLEGGNDACNTILPAFDDAASWDRYNAVRGLVLKLGKPATQTTGPYAISASTGKYHPLHPQLVNVSAMMNPSGGTASNVAMVANVGNVLGTTTAATTSVPAQLRSHNDQTTVWHDGRNHMASSGWGGRAVELTKITSTSAQANAFQAVVLGNNNVFCYGASATANVRPYGMVRGKGVVELLAGQTKVFGSLPIATVQQVMQGNYTSWIAPRTNLIELDYVDLVRRAQASQSYMTGLLAQSTSASAAVLPTDAAGAPYPLAQDLQIVAKVIAGQRLAKATGRQVFYVSLGGFDIHTDGGSHAKLLGQLDASLKYFRDALGGNMDDTVAFTASEFGRLLHSNGDGCDHGWGGHHIVMGGTVKGGKIYGKVPSYARNANGYADPQMTMDGALIPSISLGSYAASILTWFGLTTTETTSALNSAVRVDTSTGPVSGLF
jgi:uncharacterized protein (DUF1501 family)